MIQNRENGQKPSKMAIFDKKLLIKKIGIFPKIGLGQIEGLTSGQKRKKSLEPFLKNIKVSDFGLIWKRFREYLQIRSNRRVRFLPLVMNLHAKNQENR